MAANYVLLETITVGEAGAATVTFNNIPQTGYTDLKIVISARNTGAGSLVGIYPNGVTSSLTRKVLYGNDGNTASGSASDGYVGYINPSSTIANMFSNVEVYIPNYTLSVSKSYSTDSVVESNTGTTGYFLGLYANLWSVTSPITSLQFYTNAGSFGQYSTFYLYGLAAVGTTPVIAPYASGGDIIQKDSSYWYHIFLSSGTFTPFKTLSCDYVVVAGGGGGGAGGAGAGGFLSSLDSSALSLTANTAYTATIGAGGTGPSSVYIGPAGTAGGNSTFSSITTYGGGPGGTGVEANTTNPIAVLHGGSGGGATYSSGVGSYGTGTSGQGNNGGADNYDGSPYGSGGGGGAGAAGQANQSNSQAGNGGNGRYNAITDGAGAVAPIGELSGGHYYLAGGGAGTIYFAGSGTVGEHGLGGGGSAAAGAGSAGTANTGGGGGGGSNSQVGAKGGSGIVIVRYAI